MAIEKKNELKNHVCSIRRVTRVVAGGKISKFSALVVVGNGKGKVGFAQGKSVEVAEAIKKASLRAQKAMQDFNFTNFRTVPHNTQMKFGASKIVIKRAFKDCGIIASSSTRAVFEALGIQDVVCKLYGNTNAMNAIKATFKALEQMKDVKVRSRMRNLPKEHFALNIHKKEEVK